MVEASDAVAVRRAGGSEVGEVRMERPLLFLLADSHRVLIFSELVIVVVVVVLAR